MKKYIYREQTTVNNNTVPSIRLEAVWRIVNGQLEINQFKRMLMQKRRRISMSVSSKMAWSICMMPLVIKSKYSGSPLASFFFLNCQLQFSLFEYEP